MQNMQLAIQKQMLWESRGMFDLSFPNGSRDGLLVIISKKNAQRMKPLVVLCDGGFSSGEVSGSDHLRCWIHTCQEIILR